MIKEKLITIGIDATNIRSGGGVTHLVELLNAANPELDKFNKIIVWGGRATLDEIEAKIWLVKINPEALDKNLLFRTLWQRNSLAKAANAQRCDILLIPGGNHFDGFHPVVSMSQNLLPFELKELKRFGLSLLSIKLLLLRFSQIRSFRKSDGLIFLTKYAHNVVLKNIEKPRCLVDIIAHGVNPRFKATPKLQRPISDYTDANPYRILYVSIIDQYKHQWHVVEAIGKLRERGLPVLLDLVGPANPVALKRLNIAINNLGVYKNSVCYHGPVLFDKLHNYYSKADLGLFASSCENMPNILLETMAAGLPIASSNRGPMLEILDYYGEYFDPENSNSIFTTLSKLIASPKLRSKLSKASGRRVEEYSWRRCAAETFEFLHAVVRQRGN